MTDFAWTGPLALTLVKSVALLVVLLIFIAYVLYADRKIWAAAQLRRGPNVVGSSRVDLQACKLEYSIVSPK